MKQFERTANVISASRTKDLIRNEPELLANVLSGEKLCRLYRCGKLQKLNLNKIHSIVFWTKTPNNIIENKSLYTCLKTLKEQYNILFYLHTTVTGFGSTFIEYDIPKIGMVKDSIKYIIDSGLISSDCIEIRFDPLLQVEILPGYILSNMNTELFEYIVKSFSSIGIWRYTTSLINDWNYTFIPEKFLACKLKLIRLSIETLKNFIFQMDETVKRYTNKDGLTICCNPNIIELKEIIGRRGCIDGRYLNTVKHRQYQNSEQCTEILHNDVGKQQKNCMCTYSYDIGYTDGFGYCYKRIRGCIYCYSQRKLNSELKKNIHHLVQEFKDRPQYFLSKEENKHYFYLVQQK